MKRRTVLQLAAAMLAAPGRSFAQAPRRFRIGCLWATSEKAAGNYAKAFLMGLRELGYVEGRNLVVDMRWAYGDSSRFAVLAEELIALKPDVLVGVEQPAVAMKSRTATIPIVLLASTDPVAAGLVRSLARPGTNVTGFAYQLGVLVGKNIELLTEIAPKMKHIALFNYETLANDPAASATKLYAQVAKETSEAKKLALVVVSARDKEGVGRAFMVLEKERPEGLVVAATAPLFQLASEIVGQARRLRLPAICGLPGWAETGGLIGYGPNFLANYRYAATYVDRILKGAKPADMPVEQPPKFDFVVNLKTAREIGIRIPQSILLRADRVIE
ncbi:MAG: ABC transporter substrate-binding protein [Pseudomonadota bacterium]